MPVIDVKGLPAFLNVGQVQRLLELKSPRSVYAFIATQGLPHVRLSRKAIRVPVSELVAWLEERHNTQATPARVAL